MSDRGEMQANRAAGLRARHETREARAIRRQVAEELRWLALARKDYCNRCPEHQGDMMQMDPTALGVHDGHATATWLADIIEGKNDAKGWLPSWRWDEWTRVRRQIGSNEEGS